MKDHTVISVITRAQIMNDALSLAQAGLLDYEIVLNLTRYLERETEYLPWESTLSSLDYISGMMSRSSGFVLFKVRSSGFIFNDFRIAIKSPLNINRYIVCIFPLETHDQSHHASLHIVRFCSQKQRYPFGH